MCPRNSRNCCLVAFSGGVGIASRRMSRMGRTTRELLSLAWPLAAQALAYTLLGMIDRLMVGQLAEAAISGVGIGGQLIFAPVTVAGAVAGAAGILAAQARGARRPDTLAGILGSVLPLSLALGGGVTGLLVWQGPALAGWLANGESEATAEAVRYLGWVAPASPLVLLTFAMTGFLRALGDTRSSLVTSLAALGVNTGLNFLLINGYWGFPTLGVEGAAIATALSQMVGCLLAGRALARCAFPEYTFRWTHLLEARARLAWQLLALAGPIALDAVFWQAAALGYTRVISLVGDQALAAWFIFSGIRGLGYVPLGALGSAAAIVAGRHIGAGHTRRATAAVDRARFLAVAVSLLMNVGYLVAAVWYLPAFKVLPAVAEEARFLIRAFTLILPFEAVIVILSQVLRAGGDGPAVSLITLGSFWLVGVPGAWWLGVRLGWGLPGCLAGVGLECLVKSVGFWLRQRSGRWARRLVQGHAEPPPGLVRGCPLRP